MNPSPTKPSAIREEFEKAFIERVGHPFNNEAKAIIANDRKTATWAARWMAERIQQEAHARDKQLMEYEIQVMKEQLQ